MLVEDNVVFELTSLQLLHALKLHFRDIVTVHVHKDILDHNYAHLLVLPYFVDFLQQIILTAV